MPTPVVPIPAPPPPPPPPPSKDKSSSSSSPHTKEEEEAEDEALLPRDQQQSAASSSSSSKAATTSNDSPESIFTAGRLHTVTVGLMDDYFFDYMRTANMLISHVVNINKKARKNGCLDFFGKTGATDSCKKQRNQTYLSY